MKNQNVSEEKIFEAPFRKVRFEKTDSEVWKYTICVDTPQVVWLTAKAGMGVLNAFFIAGLLLTFSGMGLLPSLPTLITVIFCLRY